MRNKLIIIGGGAAGLMAAVTAGELHIPALLLERRHRPGLKLLLCGNNRCNVSHDADTQDMLEAYSQPVMEFLKPAITAFPPDRLRAWFRSKGLQTIVKHSRIYPASENSDDVLHCFLDCMRELQCPVALNCPVESISRSDNGFTVVVAGGIVLEAENILLSTGGYSYPKTGSVGDGQRFAQELGHSVSAPRPGLAGLDINECVLSYGHESDFQDVIISVTGTDIRTRGNMLCSGDILRGSAVFDTVSAISRKNLQNFKITADLVPDMQEKQLAQYLKNGSLQRLGIPPEMTPAFTRMLKSAGNADEQAALLKSFRIPVAGIRPLKEAIVTVGGVSLDEINPNTMESRIVPGLYFAGEVLDVDGPTGGYNLHAAFSTARLAISSISGRKSEKPHFQPRRQDTPSNTPKQRYGDPRAISRDFDRRKSR